MRKLIAFMLCAMLIFALPVVAYAEDEIPVTGEENIIEEAETEKPITDVIAEFVQDHLTDLGVIGTLLMTIFYEIRKHKSLNGSIGTLNNNAIKVAENSAATITKVLSEAQDIANVVKTYKDEIALLLGEVRKNAEEKQSLEDTLKSVDSFLRTAKLATLELSNEVAELLLLANIPNSKKEELYSRHNKAVQELEAVEEVISNVGTEA